MTRATLALLHGHLGEALHLHPLAVVVSPLVAGGLVYNGWSYVKQGRFWAAEGRQGRWVTLMAAALAAVMLGVWVARFFGAFGGPVPV